MKSTLLFTKSNYMSATFILLSGLFFVTQTRAQEDWSLAREWNEVMLYSISNDTGRPTIHARNLYHTSCAMYDSWAAYEPSHDTWLLGKTRGGYTCTFEGVNIPSDPEELKAAREETMSFAMFRLMSHRFQASPGQNLIQNAIEDFMDDHGYDHTNISQNYINGGPAELGNYIANEIIIYGFLDGANEVNGYANQVYQAQNDTVFPELPGNPNILNPNQWQPISLTNQISQDGSPLATAPPALSPEWGEMAPYSMTEDDMVVKQRDGHDWKIYKDPGAPPFLDPEDTTGLEDMYKWAFMMVSVWQSHNDPDDGVMWDISPASIGNVPSYPESFEEFDEFYDYFDGGETSQGWELNPKTGEPYEPQVVKRGDYARVLAEFWADGPQSYTPPGHWYEIANHAVLDHPDFERKWMGEGEELDDLEFDVKFYFGLGGSMYDAAVSAWSIKGYYDYIRPVSAIRYMCDQGQSTDTSLDNFHPAGAPLIPGYIEVVEEGDPLAGDMNEHVGKIKLYTWRGPDFIDYADTSNIFNPQDPQNHAGVGWILGENWWPWQRPNFVSPPFPGYISGHSTFSSTAAEYLERVTGDPFFPGGMGEFLAEQDEFLHFELGPSTDITLQWATYRDASDQTSLSRIWGGIHPPIDDIAGRHIGIELGEQTVNYTNEFFNANRPSVVSVTASPEIANIAQIGNNVVLTVSYDREMNTSTNPSILFLQDNPLAQGMDFISSEWVNDQEFALTYEVLDSELQLDDIFVQVKNAKDTDDRTQNAHITARPFLLDTKRPNVNNITYNENLLNDDVATDSWLLFTIEMDEVCDTTIAPTIDFVSGADLGSTLNFIIENSMWIDGTTYQATYSVADNNEEVDNIGIEVSNTMDYAGNSQLVYEEADQFSIDTRNPEFTEDVNTDLLNIQAIGNNALQIILAFDEPMDTALTPTFEFVNDNPLGTSLIHNPFSSEWQDSLTYQISYNLLSQPVEYSDIVIDLVDFKDVAGNDPAQISLSDLFIIDTQRPEVVEMNSSTAVISDSDVGNGVFQIYVEYSEPMDMDQKPVLELSADEDLDGSLTYEIFDSSWDDEFTFTGLFTVNDENIEVEEIDVEITFGKDAADNTQNAVDMVDAVDLDTRNPLLLLLNALTDEVTTEHLGDEGFYLTATFDETMNLDDQPEFEFVGPVQIENILAVNNDASGWLNIFTFQQYYDVTYEEALIEDIGVLLSSAQDEAGNEVINADYPEFFDINLNSVGVSDIERELGVTLFPNPVSSGSTVTLNLETTLNDVELRLITSAGKTIYTTDLDVMNTGIHKIPLNNVTSGLYFVQITSSIGVQTERLMVLE